ncbi:PEST proteolytic signal-containing nuclear protein-like [Onthophagus taurus]|uniref:PEST proteolytic signal-containing nuclear protein-like n=1 Tax=Onthophagus taurus TaxID=166361 RepID=UPI000C2042DF|nr:PEST proteolytic signal-containing nuclear protein-like [Onthophagus taurus]
MSRRLERDSPSIKSGSAGNRDRSRSRSPTRRDEPHHTKLENVGLGAKHRLKSLGIQMKLSGQKPTPSKQKLSVAAAFNQDSDDEPEEMPPEAKMRMRNIGRDTPTSSGPNSFGKTKQGFSDAKKVFEKNLKEAMENALKDD